MSSYCWYRGLAVLVIILLAYSARGKLLHDDDGGAQLLLYTDSRVVAQSASNVCSREVTCTACLQASPDCTWCKDEVLPANGCLLALQFIQSCRISLVWKGVA